MSEIKEIKFGDGIYVGEVNKSGKPHGKGICTYPDGSVYEGAFDNGYRRGEGIYTKTDGSVYEGAWDNGHRHGRGKYTTADGRVIEGDWVWNVCARKDDAELFTPTSETQKTYGLYHTDDKVCLTCENWTHPAIEAQRSLDSHFPGNKFTRGMATMGLGLGNRSDPITEKLTKFCGDGCRDSESMYFMISLDRNASVGKCSLVSLSCAFSDGGQCDYYVKYTGESCKHTIPMYLEEKRIVMEIIEKIIGDLKKHTKVADKEYKEQYKDSMELWKKRRKDFKKVYKVPAAFEDRKHRSSATTTNNDVAKKKCGDCLYFTVTGGFFGTPPCICTKKVGYFFSHSDACDLFQARGR